MKIKLCTNIHEDIFEEDLDYIDIEINKKFVSCYQEPDENLEGFEYSRRFFEYQKDDSFRGMFKNFNPNTRIKIYPTTIFENVDYCDDSSIAWKEGYAFLGFFQRIRLNWTFKKTWLQNSENIKWIISLLISIPVSIITAYLTTVFKISSGS